jgi:hypothetical protein
MSFIYVIVYKHGDSDAEYNRIVDDRYFEYHSDAINFRNRVCEKPKDFMVVKIPRHTVKEAYDTILYRESL